MFVHQSESNALFHIVSNFLNVPASKSDYFLILCVIRNFVVNEVTDTASDELENNTLGDTHEELD